MQLGTFFFPSLKASGEEETKKIGKFEFDMPTITSSISMLIICIRGNI